MTNYSHLIIHRRLIIMRTLRSQNLFILAKTYGLKVNKIEVQQMYL